MLVEPGSTDAPATRERDAPSIGRTAAALLDPQRFRAGLRPRPAEPNRRSRIPAVPHWVLRALALYLASRALVALGALFAFAVAPPATADNWLERWDSFWYLGIARDGYPATIAPLSPERPYSPFAFFPLWPMLVRGTGALLGGHVTLAAYLLNFLLGGLLAVLVRMVFAEVTEARTADVGVLLFVFFPGTNVFSAAYSEPLALCCAAGTLLALMRHRWLVAGVLAALAGATRPPVALAVFAALAWSVLAALRRREPRSLVAAVLAPLGLLAFALYGWQRTGHPLAWHEAEKMFNNRIDFGHSFFTDVSGAIATDYRDPATGLAILVYTSVAVLLVLAVFFVLRPPPALLTVYVVAALAVPVTTSALMPKMRFLAAAFPLLLPLAGFLRRGGRETLLGVVVGVEGALLVGVTMMNLLTVLAFP